MTLAEMIEPLCQWGVSVGARTIADRDELALRDEEAASFRHAVRTARRQSGAARIVARALLSHFGYDDAVVPRNAVRAPIWPNGVVGSLAHDFDVAIAAVAGATKFASIGIDIEPAMPLPDEIAARVATAREMRLAGSDRVHVSRLFVVKEAVFKAAHPLDGRFLDFRDIEVDFDAGMAHLAYGRSVPFAVVAGSHIVALARIGR